MWLRNGERLVLVPEQMPDTITRCLRDGWVEMTDPRTMVEPQPLPPSVVPAPSIPEPVLEPEGAPAAVSAPMPVRKVRR